jgi:DNA (cytosine-5)-methyltransferase 1
VDSTKELPAVIAFCAGYGGIERGLNLAGVEHRVIAYVEIEAFVIANLVKKMEAGELPSAPIYTDLKTFPAHLFRDRVDLITGGYPCQPFSSAGQRKGEDDPRHLWPFIRRHIESIRPVRVFFENVEGHISLGLSSVISDLEDDGYRATFGIFSASEVGAPHQRKRVYIMGDSNRIGLEKHGYFKAANAVKASQNVADSDSAFGKGGRIPSRVHKEYSITNGSSYAVGTKAPQQWLSEPRVGRVVDGCSDRVDRLRLLGNGVVPQTAAKAWMILNERFKQNFGGSND